MLKPPSVVLQKLEIIFQEGAIMQLGMIGLGRMGANMVRRLIQNRHDCVVFDRAPASVSALVKEKAVGASSLVDFVGTGAV